MLIVDIQKHFRAKIYKDTRGKSEKNQNARKFFMCNSTRHGTIWFFGTHFLNSRFFVVMMVSKY